MSWSVNKVEKVVFTSGVGEDDCKWGALETDLSVDLIFAVVSPLVFFVQVPGCISCALRAFLRLVSLLHEHVTE